MGLSICGEEKYKKCISHGLVLAEGVCLISSASCCVASPASLFQIVKSAKLINGLLYHPIFQFEFHLLNGAVS